MNEVLIWVKNKQKPNENVTKRKGKKNGTNERDDEVEKTKTLSFFFLIPIQPINGSPSPSYIQRIYHSNPR